MIRHGTIVLESGRQALVVGLLVERPDSPGVAALTKVLRQELGAAGVPLVLCPVGDSKDRWHLR